MPSGNVVWEPAWRRLHRDQPAPTCRARHRLLQSARRGGAVDKGREGRNQMDPAVRSGSSPPPPMRCAYTLGNFMRTLAMPEAAQPWSLTSLREKVIKIGAKKVVSHGRYVTFQMAEVAVPRQMFADALALIARSRVPPARRHGQGGKCDGLPWKRSRQSRAFRFRQLLVSTASCRRWTRFAVAQAVQRRDPGLETGGNPANVGSE